MNPQELKSRTQGFALDVLKLSRKAPRDVGVRVVVKQLIRSATSVGANYHSACRGRSRSEFLSKLGVVLEEADESAFWLQLLVRDGLFPKDQILPLLREADQLCAIFYSAVRTTKNSAVTRPRGPDAPNPPPDPN